MERGKSQSWQYFTSSIVGFVSLVVTLASLWPGVPDVVTQVAGSIWLANTLWEFLWRACQGKGGYWKNFEKDWSWNSIFAVLLGGPSFISIVVCDTILAPLFGWIGKKTIQVALQRKWIQLRYRCGSLKVSNPVEHKLKHQLSRLHQTLGTLEFQLRVYDDKTLPDATTMTAHLRREIRETQRAIEQIETELTSIAEDVAEQAAQSVRPTSLLKTADELQAETYELINEAKHQKDARQYFESDSAVLKVQA